MQQHHPRQQMSGLQVEQELEFESELEVQSELATKLELVYGSESEEGVVHPALLQQGEG